MAAQSVRVPFQYFTNQDGTALDNGSIYIGEANQNPETNPISTYWDAALTSAASQPISTSAGFPTYQGTPANVYVDEYSYSITVKDSSGRTVYTNPLVANENFLTVTLAELPDVPPSENLVVFLTDEGRQGQFICKIGVAPSDPLEGIYVSSNTPNFYWERVWDKINGYPEWFGAVYNSNSGSIPATNVDAFQACQTLCSIVNFRRADYWTDDTLKMNVEYRTIRGAVISDGYDTGTGTRIICLDTTKNPIQVGPDSAPVTTSEYYRNITVENLCARWGSALTPPPSGSESSAVKGWLVNYVLNCQIKNCSAWEPIIGFYFYGAVYTKVDDCQVFRSLAWGGGNDFFRGFWPQGAPAILAGGNPSLYLNRCNVAVGGSPALLDPTGLYVNADFADIFVDFLETANVDNGVIVNGSGSSVAGGKLDLHLRNCIFDQCDGNGIEILALNAMSMVTISGGYIQVNDTGAASCGITISGSVNNGSVSIDSGVQLLSSVGTSNKGIYISQQSNVKVDSSVIIEDFYKPVEIDGGSVNCKIEATINNPNTGNAGSAAVLINTADRITISCSVDGKSNAFGQGLFSVGTALDKSSIDPTLFDPAAISGGAGNKVFINSVAITSPGYYTTAGVSGTSGAGIFVTGITA
jgi:hypothetical protein